MENRERKIFLHKEEFDNKRSEHKYRRDEHQNRGSRKSFGHKIIETKLFTSKEELVEYANSKGQGSATIEIFKIEDGLYKLVIKE